MIISKVNMQTCWASNSAKTSWVRE